MYEPGQFSIRGGIIDVFSFTNDYPYRIEFFGDQVESIRSFNPVDQLSVDTLDHITIVPNIQDRKIIEKRESFLSYVSENTILWLDDLKFTIDRIGFESEKAAEVMQTWKEEFENLLPSEFFIDGKQFAMDVQRFSNIEFGNKFSNRGSTVFSFKTSPQPSFNKNFDLLIASLTENSSHGFVNYIFSENPSQIKRLYAIFDDIYATRKTERKFDFETVNLSLHEGFIDRDLKLCSYTDHQIFERYHKYTLQNYFSNRGTISLKELKGLQPGDYVVHIDHGIGKFGGLEKIDINGKVQESIRLVYQDNDVLYVSIHSLHRISKYKGRENEPPRMYKLGTGAWQKLKQNTSKKIKDIARELIDLYARRKMQKGFAFAADTYMQNELEASFIYEDTPDQVKATRAIKEDMESENPMDRLVCGDVGFGKTELAVRAAFKAVADSKQVAILVPTTILALQHYNTFRDRLKDYPCNLEYINRFKKAAQQTEIIKKLGEEEN